MWFSAKLLFQSNVDDGQNLSPLYEESIRLIEADTEDEARSKSEQLGKNEEHDYKNESGHTVKWNFVEVMEIQDLCESNIYDGMEVFSTLQRKK